MNENVFRYVNPPSMPGIRRLAGKPEDHYRLTVDLDAPLSDNFVPSYVPGYNAGRYAGCRVPIMSASGMGIESFGPNLSFFWRVVIFLLIVGFIIYLLQCKKEE